MKCDICGRVHDIEDLTDIFGRRICSGCLKCISDAEAGTLLYDYYMELLKGNGGIFKN